MKKKVSIAILLIVLPLISHPAISIGYEQLVEKKIFELKEYTTVGGQ